MKERRLNIMSNKHNALKKLDEKIDGKSTKDISKM